MRFTQIESNKMPSKYCIYLMKYFFVISTIFFMVVFCFDLSKNDLWNDEAFSYFVAHDGLSEAIRQISEDTQPPVYYALLSQWLWIGSDVWTLRLMSAVAVSVGGGFVFLTTDRVFGRSTAVLAGLFFLLNPTAVNWAQKARPYGLQMMFVAIALWASLEILLPRAGRRSFIAVICYGVAAAAVILTQYPGGFFILGCNVAALCLIVWHRDVVLFRRWVVANILMLIFILPWAGGFWHQFNEHLTSSKLQTRHVGYFLTAGDFWMSARGMLVSPFVYRGWFVLFLFVLAALVAGIVGSVRREGRMVLTIIMMVPVAVGVLGWAFVHPAFGYALSVERWLVIPLSVLIAAGIRTLPRPVGIAVALVLLAGDLFSLANYVRQPHPPLHRLAEFMASRLATGDGLVLTDDEAARFGLAYYLDLPNRERIDGLDVSDAVVVSPNLRKKWAIETADQAVLRNRIWVIQVSESNSAVPVAELEARMHLVERNNVGPFEVILFDHKR